MPLSKTKQRKHNKKNRLDAKLKNEAKAAGSVVLMTAKEKIAYFKSL